MSEEFTSIYGYSSGDGFNPFPGPLRCEHLKACNMLFE
jgi:hypothetical protein